MVLRQVSPESEALFDIGVGLFKAADGDLKKLGSEVGVSEEEVKLWSEYVASVLANLGNYKVWLVPVMLRAVLMGTELRRR